MVDINRHLRMIRTSKIKAVSELLRDLDILLMTRGYLSALAKEVGNPNMVWW